MVRNGESFPAGECPKPTRQTPVNVEISTANLACGDYQFKIQAVNKGKETVIYEMAVSLCPRHEDPTFFFGMKGAELAGNPYRQERTLKDLASAGMNMGSADDGHRVRFS